MDHTCELIRQAKDGNMEARTQLVEENVGLIWSVVGRFLGRGYEKEDLFQIGSIGLLKCIDHFDISREVKFSTYAIPLIVGEIKRFLRDDGMVKVSRSLKELNYRIYKETQQFQSKYQREPTIQEISENMDMDEMDILLALESNQEVSSIHQVIYQGDGEEVCLIDRLEKKEDEIGGTINRIYLEELMNSLTELEKTIICLRYYENKTQVIVAKELGLSQVQVSRMEKRALRKMKETG